MLTTDKKFGPDKNLPITSWMRIRIPEKKKLSICFDSIALWENALIIYEMLIPPKAGDPPIMKELPTPVIKGNFPTETGRNLTRVEIVNPYPTSSMYVYFTGWHKKGSPSGALKWEPSKVKGFHFKNSGSTVPLSGASSVLVDDSIADWGKIGFEDTQKGDEDYNDIMAFYSHF